AAHRRLCPGHGPAGGDPRAGRADDPPQRQAPGHRHRRDLYRPAPGREAARDPVRSLRALPAHPSPAHPPGAAAYRRPRTHPGAAGSHGDAAGHAGKRRSPVLAAARGGAGVRAGRHAGAAARPAARRRRRSRGFRLRAMDAGSAYYRATAPAGARYPALTGRSEAGPVIVGGGFAGLNTALGLAERGHRDVVLLEAHEVGHGASGRNGGFVFGGFSLGEASLLEHLGPERARRLYQGTVDAVERIRRRIGQYGIDCHATHAGALWVDWFRDPEELRRRQRLLAEHYGVQWEWVPRGQLREQVRSERYGDALFERNALHFNPLAYARGLAAAATGQGV